MQPFEPERRSYRRYESKARARVVRARDLMRFGMPAEVGDVSTVGLTLLVGEEFEAGETFSGNLENPVLRAKVPVRARVENVQPLGDGRHRLGCSLRTRLTVRQVHDLKSNQAEGWVGLGAGRRSGSS